MKLNTNTRPSFRLHAQVPTQTRRPSAATTGDGWLMRAVKCGSAFLAMANRTNALAGLQSPATLRGLRTLDADEPYLNVDVLMGRTDDPSAWADGTAQYSQIFTNYHREQFADPQILDFDACVPDGSTSTRAYPAGIIPSSITKLPTEVQSVIAGGRWNMWRVDSCGNKITYLDSTTPVTLRIGFDISQTNLNMKVDPREVISKLSEKEQQKIVTMLARFPEEANIAFRFVEDGESADIVYRVSELPCQGWCLAGYAVMPDYWVKSPTFINIIKTFFDHDYVQEHEARHAIFGESHDFEGSETGARLPLDATYRGEVKHVLDNMLATKMSYTKDPKIPDGTAPLDAAAGVFQYGTARAFLGNTVHTIRSNQGMYSICDKSGYNTLQVEYPGHRVHADIGSRPATHRVTVVGTSRFQVAPGCDLDDANITETASGTIIDNARDNILTGSAQGHTIITSRGGNDKIYLKGGNNVVVVEEDTQSVQVYGFDAALDYIGVAANIVGSPTVSQIDDGTQIDFAASGCRVIIMGQSLSTAEVNRTIVANYVVSEPGYDALVHGGEYFDEPHKRKNFWDFVNENATYIGVAGGIAALICLAGCCTCKDRRQTSPDLELEEELAQAAAV